MFKYLLVFSVASAFAIVMDQSAAQHTPVCMTFGSDLDGDGIGWENGANCIVETQTKLMCIDAGDTEGGLAACRA